MVSGDAVMGDIVVLGAGGRLGRLVVRRLENAGIPVVAAGRRLERLEAGPNTRRVAVDLTRAEETRAALAGAEVVVSCVHARFASAILAELSVTTRHVVLVGSTRRYTRFADRAALQVADAEAALARSGAPGVILHPTMIYGADGENNVRRIAALARRFGFIPLPDGGRRLIQPIHVDDVAACVVEAVARRVSGRPIVVAGPKAVTYADFCRAIGRACGRVPVIVPVPTALVHAGALIARLVPAAPRVTRAEIRRLTEDKNFSTDDMTARLGVTTRSLDDGLAETFSHR